MKISTSHGVSEFNMTILLLSSMEQSVDQATSANHAAELDQILASYKVGFHGDFFVYIYVINNTYLLYKITCVNLRKMCFHSYYFIRRFNYARE